MRNVQQPLAVSATVPGICGPWFWLLGGNERCSLPDRGTRTRPRRDATPIAACSSPRSSTCSARSDAAPYRSTPRAHRCGAENHEHRTRHDDDERDDGQHDPPPASLRSRPRGASVTTHRHRDPRRRACSPATDPNHRAESFGRRSNVSRSTSTRPNRGCSRRPTRNCRAGSSTCSRPRRRRRRDRAHSFQRALHVVDAFAVFVGGQPVLRDYRRERPPGAPTRAVERRLDARRASVRSPSSGPRGRRAGVRASRSGPSRTACRPAPR